LDQRKYRAFISYSHRDARWADWLHKSLESYRIPKQLVGTSTALGVLPKRLSPVFRDREELPSATDLGALLTDALQKSATQIVICSPQAAQSRWVNEEILAFKRLGREHLIFCLIVGGEPNASDLPGREAEECFPPALRFRLGDDGNLGTVRTEPIAADARPGKDGKPNAKLKLIAGLLGVGFDSLRRREQQRRNRRLVLVASGAMGGMVLTTGLAAYALIQRSAAQRQTARAEAEAQTAKETAKFMVDLFKISDPSEARGNTVTAREMLDKGATRVEHDLARQPAIQATLMDTLGSVYTGLGLYRNAVPMLDRAVATRRTLPGADPLLLSDSLNHLGDVLLIQAKYDAAEQAYKEALDLESGKPKNPQSQEELATTLHGQGLLLAAQGHYADAEKSLRAALEREHALYGAVHPEIARTLKDLALSVSDGGDLHAAIPLMRNAVETQRALRGTEPHPDTAEAINDLAVLLWRNADYDDSERYFVESLAMYRRLLGDKHIYIAHGLVNYASALQDKGDLTRAEPLYRQALDMFRELLGEAHPKVALTLHNLASVQYDRGRIVEALSTEREAVTTYRKVYPQGHRELAFALNTLGLWLALDGQYDEADRNIRDALEMRRRLLGDRHPDVASSLTVLAHLEVAQGKYEQALESARSAADIYTEALSASHWRTAAAESAQGAALAGLGRYPEAEAMLADSYGILSKNGGTPKFFVKLTQGYIDTLHRQAHPAAAAKSATAALLAPVQTVAVGAAH
jgi:tetratricopeptide (TPR) repeat protein